MSDLGNIGEFGLIKRIAPLFPSNPDVVVGIGDDCAVLRSGDQTLLVTSDLSIENVHFRRSACSPEDLGWKALAVSLSDIAAMGGVPKFGVVSVAAPAETSADFLEGIARGMAQAARFGKIAIVGGDTTKSCEGVVIDTIVIGEAPGGRYLLRAGAQDGDVACVTGPTGLSGAGFLAIQNGWNVPAVIAAHCRPTPRLAEGQWLLEQEGVHAMLDVSDGLAQDTGHLANAAGLGVDFTTDRLPRSSELEAFLNAHPEVDGPSLMLSGGEDYELALAVSVHAHDALAARFEAEFHRPLFRVGTFTSAHAALRLDGKALEKGGFDHFA